MMAQTGSMKDAASLSHAGKSRMSARHGKGTRRGIHRL